jgi:molybdopterin biosynthesis enzyme MoaB
MAITKRAMLSRAIAAIRKSTLIINLPGSPKAAKENLEFVLPELQHGLDILTCRENECGSLASVNQANRDSQVHDLS